MAESQNQYVCGKLYQWETSWFLGQKPRKAQELETLAILEGRREL